MHKNNLADLPTFHKNDCYAIIETPKGSHHKYDYDPERGYFLLKKTRSPRA